MNSIGVDLHKKIITVCVMDPTKVLARATLDPGQPETILEFFRGWRPFQVVEATASYDWFVEAVEPLASRSSWPTRASSA
ncbi:MAG: hypothetical protein U0794_02720 [Isosphaeraceae bacterium]